MKIGIYGIFGPNDKVYVGSTQNFNKRKTQHLSSLRGGYHHCSHLQHAFDKHGEDEFVFLMIEETASDIETLHLHEAMWFVLMDGQTYNNADIVSGNALRTRHTDEFKKQLSERNRNRIFTEATREKMRQSGRTKVFTDEHKLALKEARKHRVFTEETKAKISASNTGKVQSPEHIEKLRTTRIGRVVSEETRAKMRAAHTGKKQSDETKAKKSFAAQRHHAKTILDQR